jgi:hypothetical protein
MRVKAWVWMVSAAMALCPAERIPNPEFEVGMDFNSPHGFRLGPRSQLSVPLPVFSRDQGEIAEPLATQHMLSSEQAATKRTAVASVCNTIQVIVALPRERADPNEMKA